MEWYLLVLKKYKQFGGRSRRKEYWMFSLYSFAFAVLLSIVETFLGLTGVISGLYSLAVLIPTCAVLVRRLHDTDRSGWWFWIGLVPIVGVIILLVFLTQDSQSDSNKYGANPKQEL
jgi:uncharacterized membrane protein YhaH (DUF805 family)